MTTQLQKCSSLYLRVFNYNCYIILIFTGMKHSEKIYGCECGRHYKYLRNLQQHQRFDCGKEPRFSCHFCTVKCRTRYKLKMHIYIHHKK